MGERRAMILEIMTNPNIALAMLFAFLFVVAVCNLSARWMILKESFHIPDVIIGNGQTMGDRQRQEDSFATDIQDYGLLAVAADGIGSFVNGKIASKLAVQTYLREFRNADISENTGYFFKRTGQMINTDIKALYGDVPAGTTVVSAIIRQNKLYYAWAGDSTIAVFRKGSLVSLNRKDIVANKLEDLYRLGRLTREEVLAEPFKERLVNYLGNDEFEGISVGEEPITLKKGDMVLLYTNGLETLKKIELEGILSGYKSPVQTAEDFMTAIQYKNVPDKDNATVIILKINREYR